MEQFTEQEIAEAQAALDLYPDACPFWDAAAGQDVLYVAKRAGLNSTNTNRERCAAYREFCEAQRAAEDDDGPYDPTRAGGLYEQLDDFDADPREWSAA